MLLRVVLKSLGRRRLRVVVAALAVALGGLLVSALAILSFSLGQQTRRELRAYGANLLLSPRAAAAPVGLGGMDMGTVSQTAELSPSVVEYFEKTPPTSVGAYAPFLYGVARLGDAGGPSVVAAGTSFAQARALNSWWRVEGDWPEGEGQALVGIEAFDKLRLNLGQQFTLVGTGGPLSFRLTGVLTTGGSENSQVVLSLAEARALLGRVGADLVLVRVQGTQKEMEDAARAVEEALPGTQARVIRQVASTENSVVSKVQGLMGLVAGLVLIASGLAVFSTMTTTVLERTPEVGLMKALGATPGRIGLLFGLEATLIGVAGGLAGFLMGLGVAQIIGRSVFGSYLLVSPWALPLTVVAALVVSLVGSVWPIRRAVRIEAARILRGE